MSWYKEPRRHALSAKGVKTAVNGKPLGKVTEQREAERSKTPERKQHRDQFGRLYIEVSYEELYDRFGHVPSLDVMALTSRGGFHSVYEDDEETTNLVVGQARVKDVGAGATLHRKVKTKNLHFFVPIHTFEKYGR